MQITTQINKASTITVGVIAFGVVFILIISTIYSNVTKTDGKDAGKTSNEIKNEYNKLEKKVNKKETQIKNIQRNIDLLKNKKGIKAKKLRKLNETQMCLENLYPTTLKEDKVNIKGCFKS